MREWEEFAYAPNSLCNNRVRSAGEAARGRFHCLMLKKVAFKGMPGLVKTNSDRFIPCEDDGWFYKPLYVLYIYSKRWQHCFSLQSNSITRQRSSVPGPCFVNTDDFLSTNCNDSTRL